MLFHLVPPTLLAENLPHKALFMLARDNVVRTSEDSMRAMIARRGFYAYLLQYSLKQRRKESKEARSKQVLPEEHHRPNMAASSATYTSLMVFSVETNHC